MKIAIKFSLFIWWSTKAIYLPTNKTISSARNLHNIT